MSRSGVSTAGGKIDPVIPTTPSCPGNRFSSETDEDLLFYIALKDVGVETIFVRYPREGHGLREPKHLVDSIDRSIKWYEKHFPAPNAAASK